MLQLMLRNRPPYPWQECGLASSCTLGLSQGETLRSQLHRILNVPSWN